MRGENAEVCLLFENLVLTVITRDPSTPEASPGSVPVRRSFSEGWKAGDPVFHQRPGLNRKAAAYWIPAYAGYDLTAWSSALRTNARRGEIAKLYRKTGRRHTPTRHART
jgi:hypothetical protein